ncbi:MULTISPECIES: preprotein translocase subunit SecE [Shuttleworthella]|uniref:Preprotein translocase, SecE subunit n=1 Tax=Shuttleworthella satelles DSM 14600 TaxID=626523 RepID=C4GDS8_9FIRM|nr:MULTISPECIES: preprotein translocase subunit SecE [Shuttleworthia]EEP27557.1 preprotein translocase, SecE subunit [Shuttleworthia satelles DSM 14600]EUB11940.1 preprotein translocase, SecE subunit [Shuttleworthia sp. MSX8B]
MANESKSKTGFWTGIKHEFSKITWPSINQVSRESVAVVVTSVITAAIIVAVDFVVHFGLNFLVNFNLK